jgi:hypothetical protein
MNHFDPNTGTPACMLKPSHTSCFSLRQQLVLKPLVDINQGSWAGNLQLVFIFFALFIGFNQNIPGM